MLGCLLELQRWYCLTMSMTRKFIKKKKKFEEDIHCSFLCDDPNVNFVGLFVDIVTLVSISDLPVSGNQWQGGKKLWRLYFNVSKIGYGEQLLCALYLFHSFVKCWCGMLVLEGVKLLFASHAYQIWTLVQKVRILFHVLIPY